MSQNVTELDALFTKCYGIQMQEKTECYELYYLNHSHTMIRFDAPGKQAF